MKKVLYITILACSTLWGSCTEKNKQSARTDSFIEKNVAFARAQIGNEIQIIEKSEKFINPVTLKTDSTIYLNPEKPDVPLNKNDAFQKVQKRRVQEKR